MKKSNTFSLKGINLVVLLVISMCFIFPLLAAPSITRNLGDYVEKFSASSKWQSSYAYYDSDGNASIMITADKSHSGTLYIYSKQNGKMISRNSYTLNANKSKMWSKNVSEAFYVVIVPSSGTCKGEINIYD